MTTQVHKCNCKHEFQDKEYRYQNRLFNETTKNTITCTVCNNTIRTDNVRKK